MEDNDTKTKDKWFLTSRKSEFIQANFNNKCYDRRMHRKLFKLRAIGFVCLKGGYQRMLPGRNDTRIYS